MAIADYDTLLSAIQRACARSNSSFTAALPDFVAMAEDRLYHGFGFEGDPLFSPPLRSRLMETTGTITLTSGAGTLPTDYLSMRKLTRSGDQRGLTYLTPERADVELASTTVSDTPLWYTIAGDSLAVVPSWDGDLTALYYKRFDPVNTGNKAGDLIVAHGLLYFEACMIEAMAWQMDTDSALGHAAKFRGMVQGINKSAYDLRFSGPLRVRQRMPVP